MELEIDLFDQFHGKEVIESIGNILLSGSIISIEMLEKYFKIFLMCPYHEKMMVLYISSTNAKKYDFQGYKITGSMLSDDPLKNKTSLNISIKEDQIYINEKACPRAVLNENEISKLPKTIKMKSIISIEMPDSHSFISILEDIDQIADSFEINGDNNEAIILPVIENKEIIDDFKLILNKNNDYSLKTKTKNDSQISYCGQYRPDCVLPFKKIMTAGKKLKLYLGDDIPIIIKTELKYKVSIKNIQKSTKKPIIVEIYVSPYAQEDDEELKEHNEE